MLENVVCNVCGSASYRVLYKKRDPLSRQSFNVVVCSKCDLGFVNPRPTAEIMKHYYHAHYYLNRFDDKKGLPGKKKTGLVKLYEFFWRTYSRYYPPRVLKTEKDICNRYTKGGGKLLDIGCANGDFLNVMQDSGFEVCGLEFSDHFINKFGLNIFKGRLCDAPYSAHCFHLVTMWAVLEHVSDPMEYLKEIHRILKPGGVVIFLVPNLKSVPFGICHNDDIPRHLYLFSPKTIKEMLTRSHLTLKALIHTNSIFYGGMRGCVIQLILRALGMHSEKIETLNKPIVELLANRELGIVRYGAIVLSLADALVSFFLTPLLSILRYNGIIVVVAEKQTDF